MLKSTCIAKTSNENLAARYVARRRKIITENWSLELIILENKGQKIRSQLPPKYFISPNPYDVNQISVWFIVGQTAASKIQHIIYIIKSKLMNNLIWRTSVDTLCWSCSRIKLNFLVPWPQVHEPVLWYFPVPLLGKFLPRAL